MKKLVQFQLDNGESILVEVDEPQSQGIVRAGRAGELVEKIQYSFGEALDRIKPAAETIINKLRSLQTTPDQIEVEFGLKLSAEAGAFFASASTEANFVVKLSWSREQK
jgi:hypothetical protein